MGEIMKKGFRIISVLLTASVLTSEAGMAFASDLTDDYSTSEFSGELFMEAPEEEMFDEVPVEAGDAAPEIFIEDGDFLEESELSDFDLSGEDSDLTEETGAFPELELTEGEPVDITDTDIQEWDTDLVEISGDIELTPDETVNTVNAQTFEAEPVIEAAVKKVTPHWEKKGNDYFWIKEDGSILREGGWHVLGGKKYYLAYVSGRRMSGWITVNGQKYYLDPSSGVMATGWLKLGSNTHYLRSDGSLKTGYLTVNGKTYFFKHPNGVMFTGWMRKKNGHRYYFGSDGVRRQGVQTIGGKVYFFDPKYGYLHIGWVTISGNRFYFGRDGARVSGLQTIRNRLFLFDSNGILITNKPAYKINGGYYRIDANGVAKPLNRLVDRLAAERLDALGWSLPAAFNWATSLTYYRGAPEAVPSGYSQAEFYAEYGFQHHSGHCYMMACVFYEMASMLGYKVRFIKGYVPSSSGAVSTHGWVEILYNGSWYVCDPNFTYNTGRTGYMINYGYSGTWRYINYYVADQNF